MIVGGVGQRAAGCGEMHVQSRTFPNLIGFSANEADAKVRPRIAALGQAVER